MKKHRLKPRYLFLIISLLTVIIGFGVYTVIVGQTYHYSELAGFEPIELDKVEIKPSEENVVKVLSVGRETAEDFYWLSVDVESVGRGYCELYLAAGSSDGETTLLRTVKLYVLPFGMIYDLTYDSFTGMNASVLVLALILLIFCIVLCISFAEKWKNGDFSYSMVALGGVILFLLISFIITAIASVQIMITRENLGLRMFLSGIVNYGYSFVSLTAIPVLLLAIALGVSNIWLVIKEGFRPQNLLGIIIGLMMIGGFAVVRFCNHLFETDIDWLIYALLILQNSVTYLLSYFECMLISTMFCAVASARFQPKEPMDYIIILGCAIRNDGTPTPLLRGRVQRAFDFAREQYEKTGKRAKYVPSGGQGSDEVISEAESMKRCLIEWGVPEEQILKEDRSVNTYQNMAFSKEVIKGDCESTDDVSIGFSTTNYHVFRGYTLAQKVGMRVRGLSAKTKLYFFPNAFIREFIGLLWEERCRHLLFAFLIILTMTLLYMLVIF